MILILIGFLVFYWFAQKFDYIWFQILFVMKKIVLIMLLVLRINGYSQRYFPKLNNLFLEQSGQESLFSEDLNYFREGLRSANNKLFYKNLQTSNNSGAAFYSMGIIPRFVTEVDFMNTGMLIKFKGKSDEEFPSFPVIFNEFYNSDENGKFGEGTIDIFDGGISLAFTEKQISILSKTQNEEKAEFVLKKISYKINKDKLSIELDGNFTTDVGIKKQKFSKNSLQNIEIEAIKNSFVISIMNPRDNKKLVILTYKAK